MTASPQIRPAWLKIVRRLQSAVRADGGKNEDRYNVVTIRVLIGPGGNPAQVGGEPVVWTEPRMVALEPRLAPVEQILEDLIGLAAKKRG